MKNIRVFINANMAIVQVLMVGGITFYLYRFLIDAIGIERVGLWSLVLASTSIAGIGNLGISNSTVKFVAKYNARGEQETVAKVIQTASISMSVIFGLILAVVYFFAGLFLHYLFSENDITEIQILLPYALFSLWLTEVSGVYLSSIDGFQLTYIRSIFLIISSILYLIFCFLLVPKYQLIGLAYAQILQAVFILLAGWIILCKKLSSLPLIPYQWERKLFYEIIGYGVYFQINSILQMLFDPITKVFLSKFGNLSIVGYYTMASRMVSIFSGLLSNANSVLVPTIAHVYEKNRDDIKNIYRNSYNVLLTFALIVYCGIVAFSPYISVIWIGYYEHTFVFSTIALSVAWFVSTLNNPAYSMYLGIGNLRWITINHIIVGTLNVGLGLLIGSNYGGKGVVIARALALSLGSLPILGSYHYKYNIPFSNLLPRNSIAIFFASIASSPISLILYYKLHETLSFCLLTILSVLTFLSMVGYPLWKDPVVKQLSGYFRLEILKKQRRVYTVPQKRDIELR